MTLSIKIIYLKKTEKKKLQHQLNKIEQLPNDKVD
jgi:hypothetical protein